ncbi:MAG: TonB-dependent receptor [Bacteroidetes bacterium]|nr:TonB-dependent receptor [Bacteroidota bacterium]
MRKNLILTLFFLISFLAGKTQNRVTILVKDSVTQDGLPGVSIRIAESKIGGSTDANGKIALQNIPNGKQEIKFSYIGYKSKNIFIRLPNDSSHTVFLAPDQNTIEEVTVTATRTNARMDDAPMKVEVLGTEDMNEENTIKPGNISSLLGDISGIQIQQSSAVSANSNIRIQGLGGKYTQTLRDGLPLFEGFSGSFGIMQIPPLDLRQIEIIKGSASTLYGGGAIGGIINLVSKQPGEKPEGIVTLNQSTLTESNINGFYSARKNKTGMTLFAGGTRQNAVDVNKDGFSDVPEIRNIVFHPKFFYYIDPKTSLMLGASSTFENRKGGDMKVLKKETDTAHTFFEENTSKRNTGDFVFTHVASNKNSLIAKGCANFYDHTLQTNQYRFAGTQINSYGEISYLIPRSKNDLVFGVNYKSDVFTKSKKDSALLNDYNYYTLGVFVQNTFKWKEKLFAEAGLRTDYHSRYGIFILPGIAALYKLSEHWYSRAGIGFGYITPSPLAEQNTEHDLRKVAPIADSVKPEKSIGSNLEINYKTRIGENASLSINHAFFYTQINRPVLSSMDMIGTTSFHNENKPVTSMGWDTYVRMKIEDLEIYFGYTYTMARQEYNLTQKYITLTPRNRAATVITYEIEGKWRFGLEGSYTGFQYREDATRTPDYFFIAAMIEKKFKHASIVLNCENLLDARQTRSESIVFPPIRNPTFKPLWGPIDGRAINLSLVLRL